MDNFGQQLSDAFAKLTEKLEGWVDAIVLNIPNLIIAVIVAVIAMFLSKYISRLSRRASRKLTTNKTVLNLIANLSTALFSLFVIFIILGILNLDSTINKILATAGVLGLAVGLALQDPMNNLFSGVFMSVRELYNIGDLVETNGHFGTITQIDLRATKLRIPSGEEVVIPNKDVIQNPLKNYSSSQERRVTIECGVSYGDDLDHVKQVAIEAAKSLNNINLDKPIDFMYTEFGNSSINFHLRYWLKNPTQKDFLLEKSDGIVALKKAFDKHDIAIPFPIRTLDFGVKGGINLDDIVPEYGEKDVEPISESA